MKKINLFAEALICALFLFGLLISCVKYDAESNFSVEVVDGGKGVSIVGYNGSNFNVQIPPKIQNLLVTKIGDSAFKRNINLTNITIPSSVTSIGTSAFSNCTNLTNVAIPSSVTFIGYWAFEGCTNLKSITIPTSVISIGGSAFDKTAWYNSHPDGLIYINKILYSYKGKMSSGTTIDNIKPDTIEIAGYAFYRLTNLASITIPSSVISIDSNAFSDCKDLTNVIISEGVKNIYGFAFYRCTSLTNVIIPSSVVFIGNNAFRDCSSLINVTFAPNSQLKTIVDGAFENTRLTIITIPSSVMSIGVSAFADYSDYTQRRLMSVTFESANIEMKYNDSPFHGDLLKKYLANGIGTYVITSVDRNGYPVWTKQ